MAQPLLDDASDTDNHPIFKKLEEGSLDDLRNFLEVDGVPVEVEDSNGMTILMHAAWKGREDLVQYILTQGGDANGGSHGHDYKALHFAALANAPSVCRMLLTSAHTLQIWPPNVLEAGAKADHENSVNKTAAAMAGFVGNHKCIATINNFVPKEAVYYFTRKQPLESEAKLSLELAKPLYNLVMSTNVHPVKVALFFKENQVLLQNVAKISEILEILSKQEFSNTNEILALKFYILHYITRDLEAQQKKDNPEVSKKLSFIDRWIKSMLIGRESDGFQIHQENFLRQCIKEFPYTDTTIFKQLVTTFSNNKDLGEGVSGDEIINNAINGRRSWAAGDNCLTCGEPEAEKKCSICKAVAYCDQVCQKHHWFNHKKFCPQMKIQFDQNSAAEAEKAT